ncbi:hypothetical protein J6590_047789 [Homalodisca vitripennis]|nr:hypothetical protein J6590_101339 [Homalodisca vitripennis]KAG8311216.1 hypothetical protein J6590_047789 [Homalodisca vitripennis]
MNSDELKRLQCIERYLNENTDSESDVSADCDDRPYFSGLDNCSDDTDADPDYEPDSGLSDDEDLVCIVEDSKKNEDDAVKTTIEFVIRKYCYASSDLKAENCTAGTRPLAVNQAPLPSPPSVQTIEAPLPGAETGEDMELDEENSVSATIECVIETYSRESPLPTEAPLAPTKATLPPTEAPLAPTKATPPPTEAPSPPTEAPSPSTEAAPPAAEAPPPPALSANQSPTSKLPESSHPKHVVCPIRVMRGKNGKFWKNIPSQHNTRAAARNVVHIRQGPTGDALQ